jgi:Protein of unknown function (DUF3800)
MKKEVLLRKARNWQPCTDNAIGQDQKILLNYLINNCVGKQNAVPISTILNMLEKKLSKKYLRGSFQQNILVPLKEQREFCIGSDPTHGLYFITNGDDATTAINFYRNRIRAEQKHLRNLKTVAKKHNLLKGISKKKASGEIKNIYFDESGTPSIYDLKSDPFFIVGAIIFNSKEAEIKAIKIVDAIINKFGASDNMELKSNRLNPSEYKVVLNKLSHVDYEFAAICFVKEHLKSEGYKYPKNLYKQAYKFLVDTVLDYVGEANLYFDEYSSNGSSFETEFFDYLKKENVGFVLNTVDKIKMVKSDKNKLAQLADLLVGTIKYSVKKQIDLIPWIEEKVIDIRYFPYI